MAASSKQQSTSKMGSLVLMFVYLLFISLPHPSMALSSCNGACATHDDCAGQLKCINSKCNDHPDLNDFSQGGDGREIRSCVSNALIPLLEDYGVHVKVGRVHGSKAKYEIVISQ
ncbi:hypothetical protein GBA52_000901 [Prunus armeniaca]|nr:hypothetical protein GBA52_000901 [Prunus armeniaca]